ncbi:MAG: hypothetical protein SCALA702_02990 [Melioribacteraceae bacterium]|nr:MAG: hypothetical protein SCALA702_02990 [Melioribacteraceae bacterium]
MENRDDKIRVNTPKSAKNAKFVITLDDGDIKEPTNIIKMPDNKNSEVLTGIIDVAKRLNRFVKENFKSKSEFIEVIGLTPEAALEYFSYKKPMDYNLLSKLSEAGCDLNWLISCKQKELEENTGSLEKQALESEIKNLNDKNEALADRIIGLEKNLNTLKKNNLLSDTDNKKVVDEMSSLIEKRLKKVLVENFGGFQKRIVNDLVKKDDLFAQFEQIISQKRDAE